MVYSPLYTSKAAKDLLVNVAERKGHASMRCQFQFDLKFFLGGNRADGPGDESRVVKFWSVDVYPKRKCEDCQNRYPYQRGRHSNERLIIGREAVGARGGIKKDSFV